MAAVPHAHLLLTVLLLAVAAGVQVQLAVASAPPPRAYPASSSYRCGWCRRGSTASLLPRDAAALTGAACGYGVSETAQVSEEGFHIAAVSAGLFRRGQACGACYQLRCTDRTACGEDGVKVVVVADVPDTNSTADGGGMFLLGKDAFAAMINQDGGDRPARLGDDAAVEVDFRRVPCVYRDNNLSVKVEQTSVRSRGRLALQFLYQGGQTDIAAVEIAHAATNNGDNDASAPSPTTWRYMTRREGSPAVWRTSRAPACPLRLRIVVTAGSGGKWLRTEREVLPAEWMPGVVYDTGLRVVDVAASSCGCAFAAGDDEDGDEELR